MGGFPEARKRIAVDVGTRLMLSSRYFVCIAGELDSGFICNESARLVRNFGDSSLRRTTLACTNINSLPVLGRKCLVACLS